MMQCPITIQCYCQLITSSDGQFVLPSAHFPDIDGLPCFSLQNKIFKTAYTRVLHYIRSSNPHVSYSPVMVGMAHVLLHFMEEWECYIGLTTLIQRQAWLDKTQQESQSSVITLCRLAATHLVRSLSIIFIVTLHPFSPT